MAFRFNSPRIEISFRSVIQECRFLSMLALFASFEHFSFVLESHLPSFQKKHERLSMAPLELGQRVCRVHVVRYPARS